MTPHHIPYIAEQLLAMPRKSRVVHGVPLWIFENLDVDSEDNEGGEDSVDSEESEEEEEAVNAEVPAESTTLDSSTQPSIGQQSANETNVCTNGVPLRIFDLLAEDSNSTDGELDGHSTTPAPVHGSASVSQNSNNPSANYAVSLIPTAIFDTFDGGSETTDEIMEELNCVTHDPIPLESIKLEMVSSDGRSGCTKRPSSEVANGADVDESRVPAKQIKLHTNEGIVRQQVGNFSSTTAENSEGSSDLFTPDTIEDGCQPDMDSGPSGTSSVEQVQPDGDVTQCQPQPQPTPRANPDGITTNESPIGKLQCNAEDYLRPTIEAKIRLHESLRSMLPGLFTKQEAERADPLPLIEQKLLLISLVASGLQRSYCKNADLGCIASIAAQLAYGNPDVACLFWRS
ncbi:uncharacterized protein LOC118463777 [Anopheles albimanus]|uniref:uncharacterized protein LOC118463777 n=1 Tax=Anopheles albimanus TaxID=7167 RepID=UPI001640AB0C|nr:uncharacterized protein LOC118463777 [Anopheles albimanus]XP_035786484.1 uncharacterized protein LOC118463777 [Anopheles albimanus]